MTIRSIGLLLLLAGGLLAAYGASVVDFRHVAIAALASAVGLAAALYGSDKSRFRRRVRRQLRTF